MQESHVNRTGWYRDWYRDWYRESLQDTTVEGLKSAFSSLFKRHQRLPWKKILTYHGFSY